MLGGQKMKVTVLFPNKKSVSVNVANKCGSSTVRGILGYPRINGIIRHIPRHLRPHNEYYEGEETVPFTVDYKFVIVRDPVERFLSIYRQRVLSISADNITEEVTSFDYFVKNYEDIKNRYPDIEKNGHLQTQEIGKDYQMYDSVFNTNSLAKKFRKRISKISEVEIPVVHLKNTRKAPDNFDVTDEHRKIIKELFSDDYAYWQNFF
jgi:hypothetical protein